MIGDIDIGETERLLSESGLFDGQWYAARHGDTALSGLDPLTHFLTIGWRLGRDPGPGFDSRAYLAAHGDVAESGMNPLAHYLRFGANEGRAPRPRDEAARAASDLLRARLNVAGQRAALHALERLAHESHGDEAAFALRDLALWHLRQWRETGETAQAERAGHWARHGRAVARDPQLRARLLTVLLVATRLFGGVPPSEGQLATWEAEGSVSGDTWLALAGYETTPGKRLDRINRALAGYGLAPLSLTPEADRPAYDRLAPTEPPDRVNGPLVSVLIAAFNAGDSLETALRALRAQSWHNLEILVIDDCSTDGTAGIARRAAQDDPRIRLIPLGVNGGAYVARNAGLQAATGDYVTLHDADDWCHPSRIARQMDMLMSAPERVACLAEQARVTPDLGFTRLSPEAHFVTETPASLLFRRAPVIAALGGWDEVRVAADNEFIRRIRRVFGAEAVETGQTGPLALMRDHAGSAVRSGALSIDGYVTGARLAYLEAQTHFHATATPDALHYHPGTRPFPAPRIMRTRAGTAQDLSLILAADLRRPDPVVETCLQLARAVTGPVGLVPLFRPLPPDLLDPPLRLCAFLRERIDGARLIQLCPGERARAPLLVLPDPEALMDLPMPLPRLEIAQVRILADHAPQVVLPGSDRRITQYDPPTCEASARYLSGKTPEWWPMTTDIQTALSRLAATRISTARYRPADPASVLR